MNTRDFSQLRGRPDRYELITAVQLADALVSACNAKDGYLSWSHVEITDDFSIEQVERLNKVRCEDSVHRTVLNCAIIFSKVRFKGKADFSAVQFLKGVRIEKSIFEKNVDFSWSHFYEMPSFKQSGFMAEADFSVTRFFSGANYHQTTFHENADFKSARFLFPVHFDFVRFLGEKANFNGTEYDKLVSFNYSKFKASASFEFTSFNGTADYHNATFEQSVEFNLARFNGSVIFRRVEFKGQAVFTATEFGQWVDFKEVLFDVSRTFFIKTVFSGNLEIDYKYIRLPFIVKRFIVKHKKIPSWLKNMIAQGGHTFIDWSNVEKVDITNQYIQRVINDERFIKKFGEYHPVISKLWLISCDYGRSLSMWAFWLWVNAIFFAVIYYRLGISGSVVVTTNQLTSHAPDFFTSVYYSIVTFTTLGFGDVLPTDNWGRLCVITEVVLGYLMLGGLISIFANKLARRS